jgi:hypothetical protein
MAEFSAPAMVWAAMNRHELGPADLEKYEVRGPFIFLHCTSRVVIRVAISSLPEAVVEASQVPVHAQNVGDAPEAA